MEELEKWQKVNACINRHELMQCVQELPDTEEFQALGIALNMKQFFEGYAPSDVITTQYGIMHHAVYFMYCGK